MVALASDSPEAAQWSKADYEKIFSSLSPKRHCLVAEENGAAVGFIVARELGAEWEIENIAIESVARKQGIGHELMTEILSLACHGGAESVWLEVRESNEAARRLYKRCGFKSNGRRRNYYRDPEEDALLFSLTFPQAKK